jgi:hypothetical protein
VIKKECSGSKQRKLVICMAQNSGIVYINMGLELSESGPATVVLGTWLLKVTLARDTWKENGDYSEPCE